MSVVYLLHSCYAAGLRCSGFFGDHVTAVLADPMCAATESLVETLQVRME